MTTTFAAYAADLDRSGAKSFWGEIQRCKAFSCLPDIADLSEVTAAQIRETAQRVRFSAADLEAGYRMLCAAAGVSSTWPPRVYP